MKLSITNYNTCHIYILRWIVLERAVLLWNLGRLLESFYWVCVESCVCRGCVRWKQINKATRHYTTRHDTTRLRKAFVILIASLVIWIDFYTASSNTATSSRSQLTKVQRKQNATMRRIIHLTTTKTWNSKSHLTVIGFSSF